MEQEEDKKIDRFVHLHLHSSYSFTDGYGLPEQYVKRAEEIGQPALGVTDHGNISAHLKWYQQCNKAGIKPILGVEFYIVEDDKAIRNSRDYYHITVLVKNNIGYKNLMKLVTKSWTEENFYYKPQITFKDLIDNQQGLIVLSGCLSSPVMKNLQDGNVKKATEIVNLFHKSIDNFYIEVQPISFPEGLPAYQRLLKLYNDDWKKNGIKIVATNDCHYVCKEQNKIQEILLCIQSNDTMSNPKHWKFDQDDFYLKTREEMQQSLNAVHPDFDFTESLDNTVKIAEMVDFEFPKADPIRYPMKDKDKTKYLRSLCDKGMIKRKLEGDNLLELDLKGFTQEEYKQRLDYEIDLMIQKNFIDYFLVITDLVQWAKKQNILVGPARGSAAGSLACYVLEITEVEPMRHGLIFERFIDLNREDLPDVDIDFEDTRRHEVKEYLENKYGKDKVGNLPIFAAFKGKSAIDDIGRVFKINFGVLDKVKKAIIERSGGDSRASFTLEDTFTSDVFEYPKIAMQEYPELKYAIELEGQLRQMGQHAAGVVISNEPLTNFCAIYKVKDNQVISMDYKDASDTGLLKIDILGLNTLSVVSKTIKLIKERHNETINIYNLPLDDPKVYKGFCDGKLFGIFQFDGQAVNQVCRQIMPKEFESLSAISALARPGPLNSGSTTMYIQRRAGNSRVEYSHPVMEPFTKETYGIVVYQEQVMKTMREVGKMSWKDTSEIRKLISRSQGVEKFNTFKDKFSIGARENGMNDKQIDKIWDSICTFGSWAFNKCISGDSIMENCNPNQFSPKYITIEELYKNSGYATDKWRNQPAVYKKMNTLGMDLDGKIRPSRIKNVFQKGLHQVYEITTESGRSIRATSAHRFLGIKSFKKVHKFSEGELIAINGGYQESEYTPKGDLGKGWRKGRIGGAGDSKDGSSYEVSKFRENNIDKNCEHCDILNDRMEVHHVTRTAPNSILEWLCPGCHKKAEYKLGRTKVWEKGSVINYEKIISIEKLGKEIVYDVEMEDDSRPSFVANGFISHNSHSVSYTVISYWTMWLKVHYPMEFYSSIMFLTEHNDKKKKIMKEYLKEGYKLLPVDINKSKEGFSIDGVCLRIGFSDIKGIGSKQSNSIVKHQPYLSYTDFEVKNKKARVKSTTKQDLINLGAFDSIGNNTAQTTLFGEEIKEYEKEEMSFAKRFSICPWDMEFGIDKNWLPLIRNNMSYFRDLPTPISTLKDMEQADDILIYGIVYDKNLRDAREVSLTKGKTIDLSKYSIVHILNPEIKKWFKNNEWVSKWAMNNYKFKHKKNVIEGKDYKMEDQFQFANFVIEDDTDFITVRLSHIAFPQYGKLIFEGINAEDPVAIRGKMGTGIRLFFANRIVSLKHYKEKLLLRNKII